MNIQEFDRSRHIYHNEAFVELVKDAVRFFHGTPVTHYHLLKYLKGQEYMQFIILGKTRYMKNMHNGIGLHIIHLFTLEKQYQKAGGKQEFPIIR